MGLGILALAALSFAQCCKRSFPIDQLNLERPRLLQKVVQSTGDARDQESLDKLNYVARVPEGPEGTLREVDYTSEYDEDLSEDTDSEPFNSAKYWVCPEKCFADSLTRLKDVPAAMAAGPAHVRILSRLVRQKSFQLYKVVLDHEETGILKVFPKWIGLADQENVLQVQSEATLDDFARAVHLMYMAKGAVNLIEYRGVWQDECFYYILQDNFKSFSLSALATAEVDFKNSYLLRDLLRGLASLHDAGVVHGNLDFNSVYVDSKGNFRISMLEDSFINGLDGPEKRKKWGLEIYSSPEIVTSLDYTDKSDIWSFGIVAYYLHADKSPWDNYEGEIQGSHNERLRHTITQIEPDFASIENVELRDILRRYVLVKDPSKRLSACELLELPFFNRSQEVLTFKQPKEKIAKVEPALFNCVDAERAYFDAYLDKKGLDIPSKPWICSQIQSYSTSRTPLSGTRMSTLQYSHAKLIGQGSYGKVFRALLHTSEVPTLVAIKVLSKTTFDKHPQKYVALGNANVARIAFELCILKHLDGQDHVCAFRGAYTIENSVLLMLQYYPQGSVHHYLSEFKKFPLHLVQRAMQQILNALVYLKEACVVHRDISAKNVLIDSNGDFVLSDFGLAVFKKLPGKDAVLPIRGVCGTLEYMSPEMLNGEAYDYKTDIWSLGVLLYRMDTGKAPFQGNGKADLLNTIKNGNVDFSKVVNAKLSSVLAKNILQPEQSVRPSAVDLSFCLFLIDEHFPESTKVHLRAPFLPLFGPDEQPQCIPLSGRPGAETEKFDTNLMQKVKCINTALEVPEIHLELKQ